MTDMMKYIIPEPEFEKLFRVETILDNVYPLGDIGMGYSEITTVNGGSVDGVIHGEIMNFGGDWGLLHSDDINELNAKYLIKTNDGAYISMISKGKLIMSMEDLENGETEQPSPSDYYFRSTVEFSAGDEKYKWLNKIVAIAMMMITPEGNVCLDVYKLK